MSGFVTDKLTDDIEIGKQFVNVIFLFGFLFESEVFRKVYRLRIVFAHVKIRDGEQFHHYKIRSRFRLSK